MEQPQPVAPQQWYMLIEETITNGQSIEWSPTATHPAGPDVDQARRIAADAALTYRPKHPKRPKRRQVFQTGPDNWLVVVTGALLTAETTT